MKISVPKESYPGENRAPMTPDSAAKLVKLGAQVEVEAGLGVAAGFPDEAYTKAGATITTDRKALIGSGDIVLRLRKPPVEEISWLKPDSIHASLLDPFNEKELVKNLPSAASAPSAWNSFRARPARRKWTCFRRRRTSAVTRP